MNPSALLLRLNLHGEADRVERSCRTGETLSEEENVLFRQLSGQNLTANHKLAVCEHRR